PPTDTHFPYTTLFRSRHEVHGCPLPTSGPGRVLSPYDTGPRTDIGHPPELPPENAGARPGVPATSERLTLLDHIGQTTGHILGRSEEHTSELQSRDNL